MSGEPQALVVDLEAAEKIAEGNDSHVYLQGDQVYKEYQRLDLEATERYVRFMTRAVSELVSLDYRGSLTIAGVTYSFVFEGLPVRDVGLGPRALPMTVSDYMPEPDLDKLTQNPLRFTRYPIDRVRSSERREFFVALNRLFYEESPTRVQDEFHYHIDLVSRMLDDRLDVSGIYIGKYNVKLLPKPGAGTMTLLVTDLSVYLDRLRYENASGSRSSSP